MAGSGKKMSLGLIMLALFAVVLVLVFMPLFPGKKGDTQKVNGLDYLDNLYNTISKGSAYYIPKIADEAKTFQGKSVEMNLSLPSEKVAQQAQSLVTSAGAQANAEGKVLKVQGDWGQMLVACLADADLMYHNKSQELAAKHEGMDAKSCLHAWWQVLKSAEKDLNRQKKFAEARMSTVIMQKAVESAYNYFGIEPRDIGQEWGLVAFSLLFYVLYTVWYGFGIMYLAEGLGLRLEH
jgi:hypothetical protein